MIKTKSLQSFLYHLVSILVGLIVISPIIYAVSISLMRPDEILRPGLHFIPDGLYFGNYMNVFEKTTIFRFMINSLVISVGTSVVRIIICSMAAFAFAFFEFRFKKVLFFLVLGTMLIPEDILIVQNYDTVSRMGLINTYLGMMLPSFATAVSIFILRQYFLSYSKELKEAAHIDGCSNFTFYTRILLPSTTPVLSAVFITTFIGAWNSYLWPLIVTNKDEMRPVQVAITMLNFPDGSPHGSIMAAAVLILVPTIVLFLVFQKQIISGTMAGSVKG